MYNKLTGQFEIYELDSSTQAWGAIGEAVDERENTRSDTLWDQRRSNMACAVCDARAGATNLLSEDESGIVRYDDKIGVMWSNQNDDAMYFASHRAGDPDDQWQPNIALKGPELADNHLNLKGLDADPAGQVFAAAKTSLNGSGDPLINLLVLKNGNWSRHAFGTVPEQHTRAIMQARPAAALRVRLGSLLQRRQRPHPAPLRRRRHAPHLFVPSEPERRQGEAHSQRLRLLGLREAAARALGGMSGCAQ